MRINYFYACNDDFPHCIRGVYTLIICVPVHCMRYNVGRLQLIGWPGKQIINVKESGVVTRVNGHDRTTIYPWFNYLCVASSPQVRDQASRYTKLVRLGNYSVCSKSWSKHKEEVYFDLMPVSIAG